MGYEDAPATKMLATQCAVCRRPLLDAKSVEIGMGPDCRKQYQFDREIPPQDREDANKIIHKLALQEFPEDLPEMLAQLLLMSFTNLFFILVKRKAAVRIIQVEDTYSIKSAYQADFIQELKKLGGRWHKEGKEWWVPTGKKAGLWEAIKKCFPGRLAFGPKGCFWVPNPDFKGQLRLVK